MNENVYKVPESNLIAGSDQLDGDFYVVGKVKFLVLFFSTFGLYSLYWFYRNWKLYKEKHNEKIWPVARGFFSIFFAHSLFSNVDQKLSDSNIDYSWNPKLIATLYVLISIVTNICDRLSMKEIGSPYTDLLSFALLPALAWVMLKAQLAINVSEGDPIGASNSKLTIANYCWVLLGVVAWGLVVVGVLMILGIIPE